MNTKVVPVELLERVESLLLSFEQVGMCSHDEDGKRTPNADYCRQAADDIRKILAAAPGEGTAGQQEKTAKRLTCEHYQWPEDCDLCLATRETAAPSAGELVMRLTEKLQELKRTFLAIDMQAERITERGERLLFKDGNNQSVSDDDYENIIIGYKLNTGLWHRVHGLLADITAATHIEQNRPADAQRKPPNFGNVRGPVHQPAALSDAEIDEVWADVKRLYEQSVANFYPAALERLYAPFSQAKSRGRGEPVAWDGKERRVSLDEKVRQSYRSGRRDD